MLADRQRGQPLLVERLEPEEPEKTCTQSPASPTRAFASSSPDSSARTTARGVAARQAADQFVQAQTVQVVAHLWLNVLPRRAPASPCSTQSRRTGCSARCWMPTSRRPRSRSAAPRGEEALLEALRRRWASLWLARAMEGEARHRNRTRASACRDGVPPGRVVKRVDGPQDVCHAVPRREVPARSSAAPEERTAT